MSTPIRIILVDDHNLVRESLKALLDKDNRFDVVATCETGAEAIEKAKNLSPDIILMDINMSPMNGFETTQKIIEFSSSIGIIGVSVNNNPKYAEKLIALGARGFVTKTSAFSELKIAIQKVFEGEKYICNEVTKRVNNLE